MDVAGAEALARDHRPGDLGLVHGLLCPKTPELNEKEHAEADQECRNHPDLERLGHETRVEINDSILKCHWVN